MEILLEKETLLDLSQLCFSSNFVFFLYAGLKRTGKSCRLRWLNYLKPDTIRGNLTPHEQLLILELHSRWGNRSEPNFHPIRNRGFRSSIAFWCDIELFDLENILNIAIINRRWSKIAQQLPGRTDNEIKNYWRTRVQKQARQLKVDSNSNKFLEAVRLYWMPRLREKMEQSTSSSSATSSPSSSTSTSTSETPNVTVAAPTPLQINGPVIPPAPPKSNGAAIDISDGVGIQEISGFLTSFDRDGCCMQELGCGGASTSECNVAGVDWLAEEVENSFWNSYELWH